MDGDVGQRFPSPAMWARVATGLIAVAALESSGLAGSAWVWVAVAAAGVLLFVGVEQLCRRHVRGARRGEVLRTADLLVAAAAAVVLFGIAALFGAGDAGWLGPPGVMAAVLLTDAFPDRLAGSWSSLRPLQQLMVSAAVTLPAVLTVAAVAVERMNLAGTVAMPVGIFILTVAAAVLPQEAKSEQRSESGSRA